MSCGNKLVYSVDNCKTFGKVCFSRKALDIFYRSRLVKEIEAGLYGLDCMDAKWLADDLKENEPELFEQSDD